MFLLVRRLCKDHPKLNESVRGQLQSLLLSVVMSSIERNLYMSVSSLSEVKMDDESVKLLREVFGAIAEYLNDEVRAKSYEKGFFVDFYVVVLNRFVVLLSMPGDKVGMIHSVQYSRRSSWGCSR